MSGDRSSAAGRQPHAIALHRGTGRAGVPIAGLFPGQGSQTPGMRELVERAAPELLALCEEALGVDPFPLVGQSTRFAQPAIFCASIAAWQAHVASEAAKGPAYVYAGHSLGELAALVAAGAIELQDGLRLAVLRGELMASAAEADGDGGMLALLGASEAQWKALAHRHGVVLANDNAPGQAVLAGAMPRLRELAVEARKEGLRAMLLDVAGAFHSPAMASAVAPFAAALEEIELCFPSMRVISCASAAPFIDIRAELARAIVRPVRWRETMQALAALGASAFVDFGPGQVLARLVTRNVPDVQARSHERAA